MQLTFAPPASDASVIAALGKPASWREKASPADLLEPRVRAAAELARAIALRTAGPGESDIYEKEERGPARRDP